MINESSADLINLRNQLELARREINNLRQQLTSFKHEHKKICNEISNKLNNFKCINCESNSSSSQPSTSHKWIANSNNGPFKYIGMIHTEFPSKRGIPRQPNLCSEAIGKLVLNDVFTNPQHALDGLEKFSHMWILFHFHQTESTHFPAKVTPPRLNGMRVGVFGTRSPHRPSPIGLSLVKISEITGNSITFNGVDMMDQTPVLDIKPFIPHYDVPSSVAYGYSTGERSVWLNPSDVNGITDDNIPEDEGIPQNSESRTLVGQESERDMVPGASIQDVRRNSSFNDNSHLRMTEREAPDGEEEGSVAANTYTNAPSQSDGASQSNTDIRVPRWLDNPVVPTLTVQFKISAEIQLRQFGAEKEEKKKMIQNILSQDPRSIYLREQQGDNEFVFRIADVYVCCLFNNTEGVVYVNKILMAEEYGPSEKVSH